MNNEDLYVREHKVRSGDCFKFCETPDYCWTVTFYKFDKPYYRDGEYMWWGMASTGWSDNNVNVVPAKEEIPSGHITVVYIGNVIDLQRQIEKEKTND